MREDYACREDWAWYNERMLFNKLPIPVKDIAGATRADMHNKSIDRQNTIDENFILLNEFVNFFNSKNINILLVATPKTKYYLKYFDNQYKNIFYDNLDRLTGTIHLLDITDSEEFQDKDFDDSDHLGDSGAKKMTEMILKTLDNIG